MKSVLCLVIAVTAGATVLQTAPDAAAEVALETAQNLQIHDGFATQAEEDEKTVKKVEANKDLQALLQTPKSFFQVSSQTAPDAAAEVALETAQNLQIHDGFATQADEDDKVVKQVKANRDLQALQTSKSSFLQVSSKTAPDAAAEVAIETQQNLQIHDGFATQAEEDDKVVKQVRANRDLQALQTAKSFLQLSSKTAPDAAAEVAIETQQNLQIHDGFATQAEEDDKVVKQVRANRDLQALQTSKSSFLQVSSKTAPDAAAEVAIETQQNLQIHDGFATQADADEKVVKQVRANRDLQALQTANSFLQVSSQTAPDAAAEVAMETQQNLQIHDGFATQAAEDDKVVKQVAANRDLQALQTSKSDFLQMATRFLQVASKTAPDAAREVALETQVNFQIHDAFATQAEASAETQKEIEANKEFAALQTSKGK